MINQSSFILGVALLVPSLTLAGTPNASIPFLRNCAERADCELVLFREIAKTFRPSREEDELRDYLLAIKRASEEAFWGRELETFRDPVGNLMIRLPATGAFAAIQDQRYFALQSHMDMVLAYSEARPGEDLRPYFRNGIDLVEKDGWLESRDRRTSIGVDNGIGVALAIRYLIDPSIAHPPLELIFTVQEETGLIGAFRSELPILSRKMLCLDGMTPEEGQIVAGSQGGITHRHEIETVPHAVADWETNAAIRVSLIKIAGGHSGGDIHRDRLNAMKAFAAFVKGLRELGGPVFLRSAVVGDPGVFNKIPSLFEAELIIPRSTLASTGLSVLRSELLRRARQNEDDAVHAEVSFAEADPGASVQAASSEFTAAIVDAILAAPNGVIESDPRYFNGVFTSNNLSFLRFGLGVGRQLSLLFGHMTRGFDTGRMKATVDAITEAFARNSSSFAAWTNVESSRYDAWLEPETSGLLRDVLTKSGYFDRTFFLNGGLEPSAFKMKYPDLEVVALGPATRDAHSVNERLRLDSVPRVVNGVRLIVQSQGM